MHTCLDAKPLAHRAIFIPGTLSKEQTLQSQKTAREFPISSSLRDGHEPDLHDEKQGGG
jgi:hypothetical protein